MKVKDKLNVLITDSQEGNVWCGNCRVESVLDTMILLKKLSPDGFCPMRRNRSDQEGLKLDKATYEIHMHPDTGRSTLLSIPVSCGLEVVKA